MIPRELLMPFDARPIPNREGYFITPTGEVWTGLARTVPPRPMKIAVKLGYRRCHLGRYGRTVHFVHRLVLETFVGPRPPNSFARHLDGNPANNHFSNLKWGTLKENAADRDRHGKTVHGEAHSSAKLSESDVISARREFAAGSITCLALARKFGVSDTSMRKILTGKRWKHVPSGRESMP